MDNVEMLVNDHTSTQTIKGVLAALAGTHIDDLEGLSLQDQVEIGAALWDIINRANTLIDPIKASLRKEAIDALNGCEGAKEFLGTGGKAKATVQIPKPSTKVRKSVDMVALKEQVGESLFDEVFTTNTSYKVKATMTQTITKLGSVSSRDSLMDAIEVTDNTPRVNFRR